MSSFTEYLDLRSFNEGLWELTRPMTYYMTESKSRHFFTVPKGFRTDLASIPRPFWSVIGHPSGMYRQAAVLHDYLYSTKLVSRHVADVLFLEGMQVLGIGKMRRWVIYLSVRFFGGKAWRDKK